MKHFIDELRRRHVFRFAVAYLAGAWLLVQVLETLFPIFGVQETRNLRVILSERRVVTHGARLPGEIGWKSGAIRDTILHSCPILGES